jgi:2-polyprenyl-3-methyl-5-hydroxy-6-metoxy-1,4-benzoquinol methylase
VADQADGLLSPWLRRRRIAAARLWLRGRVLDFGCGVGALAGLVPPERYLGVDIDEMSLDRARRRFPRHEFYRRVPTGRAFDTVVGLAILEHVSDPAALLAMWRTHLCAGGRVVLTTPHPLAARIHRAGAAMGLFSREADAEHQPFLGRTDIRLAADEGGLRLDRYHRFLLGLNQLAILSTTAPA